MRLKYIITSNGSPVLFTEAENHSDVAQGLFPVSAGFVLIGQVKDEYGDDDYTVQCYGKSVSLKGLESRLGVDDKIIHRMLKPY